jgi:hypothetical protein
MTPKKASATTGSHVAPRQRPASRTDCVDIRFELRPRHMLRIVSNRWTNSGPASRQSKVHDSAHSTHHRVIWITPRRAFGVPVGSHVADRWLRQLRGDRIHRSPRRTPRHTSFYVSAAVTPATGAGSAARSRCPQRRREVLPMLRLPMRSGISNSRMANHTDRSSSDGPAMGAGMRAARKTNPDPLTAPR